MTHAVRCILIKPIYWLGQLFILKSVQNNIASSGSALTIQRCAPWDITPTAAEEVALGDGDGEGAEGDGEGAESDGEGAIGDGEGAVGDGEGAEGDGEGVGDDGEGVGAVPEAVQAVNGVAVSVLTTVHSRCAAAVAEQSAKKIWRLSPLAVELLEATTTHSPPMVIWQSAVLYANVCFALPSHVVSFRLASAAMSPSTARHSPSPPEQYVL
eukprot:TRINITY_DN17172_c0_g1_i1.p2 TRINITY_DN17172_c0_g1~~TRINITY_DN17172_c0_g1_i1.p2  ORF type:complete len:212 (-),score=36.69 TRINITY_DN17172_c0_g1_i1:345-980(-)